MRALRLLVIDDDRDVAESLAEYLELDGHRVDVCHSAADGLAAARTGAYHQIIVDVGLPDADGTDTARHILDDQDGVSVLLISGHSARDLGIEGDASSRMTLLAKPLDPAALSARLALLASGSDGAG